jgi:MarR family transcriptional regulator, organic hydroperoxide resistance regulator
MQTEHTGGDGTAGAPRSPSRRTRQDPTAREPLQCGRHPETSAIAEKTGPVAHALFRVTRVNKTMIGAELRRLGLANGQELLLLHLWERDGCTQSDLVGRLGIDPSTVTKMLQRLERDGWVRRCHSEQDARSVLVHLTPAGRDLEARVTALWTDLENATVAPLSAQERAALLGLLRKVERGLHERT